MKTSIPFLFSFIALSVVAQETTTDTISSKELDEVVIQAPKVITKADMDVYVPSQTAVKYATNGLQLIKNLMIPTVVVNEMMGSVTDAGQSVQIRINGRVASIDQVKVLLPGTIKRVEYIDNPGLRYGDVSTVINIIAVNPTLGGSLMLYAMPALTEAWGQYFGSLKLNYGRSQFSLDANYHLTNKLGAYREYEETIVFPDNTVLNRKEKPKGGQMTYTNGNMALSYSYIIPNTTTIYTSLFANKLWNSSETYKGSMSNNLSSDIFNVYDFSKSFGTTPGLSFYVEQHLQKNQTIVVDASASFYNGNTDRVYTETLAKSGTENTAVGTFVKDSNQAYAFESDYIKNWRTARLTGGISYSANRNRSTYINLDNSILHQSQDRVYMFGEYFQRINKLTLTAGIGAQYTSLRLREHSSHSESWNIRPKFTATYSFSSSSQVKLDFTSWQTAPSLSETNAIPQQIDGFQWLVGNPNLKTASFYSLRLHHRYVLKRFAGTISVKGKLSPNMIARYSKWDGDRLITSFENSKGLQSVEVRLSPQFEVIPGWFNISGTLLYIAERSQGNGYHHYNHDWSGSIQAQVFHKGFIMTAAYERAPRYLQGETLNWGETFSLASIGYRGKQWSVDAGVLMPFNKYDRGSKLLNQFNSNNKHIRIDMNCIPVLTLSYNLNWGRQLRNVSKKVNAESAVEHSQAATR